MKMIQINGSFFSYIFLLLIHLNEREENMEILKVSSKSRPNSVAGALANVFREKGKVEIQAIGAGALNQAIKSIAIARGFVAPSGKDLVCIPAFSDISMAVMWLFFKYFARLMAIHPEPVPISNIFKTLYLFMISASMLSTNISVSCLGIRTSGFTLKVIDINS